MSEQSAEGEPLALPSLIPGTGKSFEEYFARTEPNEVPPSVRIASPSAPPVKNDVIWHYTDAAGALGIITMGTLRASSALFLNDTEETTYGHDLLQSLARRVIKDSGLTTAQRAFITYVCDQVQAVTTYAPLHILCASTEKDLLSQ